jgi:hypothetical protein
MKKCSGCSREFDDAIPLYPRLILTKEAQVARKLAESVGDDILCLTCWLEAINAVDSKDLALLLLGMLDKINALNREVDQLKSRPSIGIGDFPAIDTRTYPNVYPSGKPYTTTTPWTLTSDKVYTHEVTWGADSKIVCSADGGGTYLSGKWTDAIS